MADEDLGGQAVVEPAALPVDDPGSEQNQEINPVEALAIEIGWAPKDQWKGNEADWKPADEFIRSGRDINQHLSRELRSVRDEVSRMGRVSSQIMADKIAERDAHWQNVHRKAVEEGDVQLAERASDERSKLKSQTPAADNAEPPETQDFRRRHDAWFGKDRVATMRAMEVAERSRQMGASPAEQLEDAERVVRQEFPKLFPAPAKAAPGVQTSQTRNANASSGKKGFADMPQASQDMARDYLKRHGMPLEKFAESYWGDPSNYERKVG